MFVYILAMFWRLLHYRDSVFAQMILNALEDWGREKAREVFFPETWCERENSERILPVFVFWQVSLHHLNKCFLAVSDVKFLGKPTFEPSLSTGVIPQHVVGVPKKRAAGSSSYFFF